LLLSHLPVFLRSVWVAIVGQIAKQVLADDFEAPIVHRFERLDGEISIWRISLKATGAGEGEPG
jgi:hypothetical protein